MKKKLFIFSVLDVYLKYVDEHPDTLNIKNTTDLISLRKKFECKTVICDLKK